MNCDLFDKSALHVFDTWSVYNLDISVAFGDRMISPLHQCGSLEPTGRCMGSFMESSLSFSLSHDQVISEAEQGVQKYPHNGCIYYLFYDRNNDRLPWYTVWQKNQNFD
jgi:hypothetical protein